MYHVFHVSHIKIKIIHIQLYIYMNEFNDKMAKWGETIITRQ